MEELRSEHKEIKKKVITAWLLVLVLFISVLLTSVFDYLSYKEGQQYGLAAFSAVNTANKANIINPGDSYTEQCHDLYLFLNRSYSDFRINGIRIDASKNRAAQYELKESFYDLMDGAGYSRYTSSYIENWFLYTSILEYFSGYSYKQPIAITFYIVLVAVTVWTIITARKNKRELIVQENTVICKTSPTKSKELLIPDIISAETSKDCLLLSGNNFKFRISNIRNGEELKEAIIKRKVSAAQ